MKRITLFSILLLFADPVVAEPRETCDCDVSKNVVAAYDQALVEVNAHDALRRHAPWGTPVDLTFDAGTRVLYQRHWLVGYDQDLRMPIWVAYRLQAEDLAQPRRRTQCFRSDARLLIRKESTRCASYRGSGFDRGHLVPSADMVRSEQAMVNSYVFSNIAPQYPRFNRGVWRKLEGHVRDLARTHGSVFVMSGAIFDQDNDGRRDADADAPRAGSRQSAPRAAIASHFYKVIMVIEDGQARVTAWLLAHDNDPVTTFTAARVSLAKIETLSGLDIFPHMLGELAGTFPR